jgi:hypothetical protein
MIKKLEAHFQRNFNRVNFEHGGRFLPPSNIPIDSADVFELIISSNNHVIMYTFLPTDPGNRIQMLFLTTLLGDGANFPRFFREKGV